jgi:hypothetical protein
MFSRVQTDGTTQAIDLRGFYAGTERSACWIVGGGPSLADLPVSDIAASPIPKFAVNLAGHGLLRPNFWTSYDPTARFLRSIYLDPSIVKFVHRRRAMDLVPETTTKVCDAPATLFFERNGRRGFHEFPGGKRIDAGKAAITDWQDSLIQAIELAWWLGFRTLYLIGAEMCVRPSAEQTDLAATVGVEYQPLELLRDFSGRCRAAGISQEELESVASPGIYHFDEQKSLAATIQTDQHYFRVAQYLRLSRRAMSLAGLELFSVTPVSRLNAFFPVLTVDEALSRIHRQVGDPRLEATRGRYGRSREPVTADQSPMRDYPPHNWKRERPKAPDSRPQQAQPASVTKKDSQMAGLRRALENLPEIEIEEEG